MNSTFVVFKRTITASSSAVLLAAGLTGCATRADLEQLHRNQQQARRVIADQTVALEDMRRRIEMMQAAREDGAPTGRDDSRWRMAVDERLGALERGVPSIPPGVSSGPDRFGEAPPVGVVPMQPGGMPPAPSPLGTAPTPAVAAGVTPGPAGAPVVAAAPRGALGDDIAREEAALRGVQVDAEYRTSIDLIRAGQCKEAVPRLRGFVRKNIKSPFADNAQYWIGRCFHAQGDHNRAIMELYDVLLKFPKSERVPGALLVLADAFADSGDDIDARLTLKKLLSDHPQAEEVEAARARLRALGE